MTQKRTEYAAQGLLDMPTQIGMRHAMLEAVSGYKALESGGGLDGKSNEEKQEIARSLIENASEKHPIIQGAGTAGVVQAYFNHVIDQQESPDNLINFLDAINAKDVEGITEAIQENDNNKLLKAAGGFSKAFREELGQETLTGSFDTFLKENSSILQENAIVPRGFTEEQAEFIDQQEEKFRKADEMDGMLYSALKRVPPVLKFLQDTVGIGFPMVTDRIAEFDRSHYPVLKNGQAVQTDQPLSQSQESAIEKNFAGLVPEGLVSDLAPMDTTSIDAALNVAGAKREAVRDIS